MSFLSRRKFIHNVGSCVLGSAFLSAGARNSNEAEFTVYIGTYTGGKSDGIYTARFSRGVGTLRLIRSTRGLENPSFLAFHPGGNVLYAVSETETYDGHPGGSLAAYRRNPENDKLTLLNRRASHGGAPCYVSVDPTGRCLLAANYLGGNVVSIPLSNDGSLSDRMHVIQHTGTGPDRERQEGPHAHSINLSPDGKYAVAIDLGIDQVIVYPFDAATGILDEKNRSVTRVAPGAGPRHFVFHPDGKRAYVINELNSTITSFTWNSAQGRLTPVSSVSTLPEGSNQTNSCADLHIDAQGRFLYGSNRGHNSIVVLGIGDGGAMRLVQHQSTLGDWPRNFALDPSGRFLLAANQKSGDVVVFSRDASSGRLEPTGHRVEIPDPVCIRFVP